MRTGRISKSRIILSRFAEDIRRFLVKSPLGGFIQGTNLQSFLGQAKEVLPPSPVFNPDRLNCRIDVQFRQDKPVFDIKIRGKITVEIPGQHIKLHTRFNDITNGINSQRPVYRSSKNNLLQEQQPFEHICELGKVPNTTMEISDWLSIAQIDTETLLMPQQETEMLLAQAELFCCETSQQLDMAQFWFQYENRNIGYLDIQDTIDRAKALGVTLAFSVCAAEGKLCKPVIQYIRQWAASNIGSYMESGKKNRKLDKALNTTICFFDKGQKVDIVRLAMELTPKVPIAYRYSIIELCICAAAAKGIITDLQFKMLKDIAFRLELDMEKFRSILERMAPETISQVKDLELLFGLTSEMDIDQSIEKLNSEYRKWNARVTHIDAAVQKQAEQMLNLIAQARAQYTS
jgi:hypothetical protein